MSFPLPRLAPCLSRTAYRPARLGLPTCMREVSRRPPSFQCLHGAAPPRQQSAKLAAPPARSSRPFTTTLPRPYKTVQEARSRHRSGPFSTTAALLFLTAGAGMIFYFRYEKARMERKRVAEAAKGMGRPKVGGKFELVDQEGRVFTEDGMRGKFSLVYFGFTHCPDICPEELDKMARMIDLVSPSAAFSSPVQNPSSTSPSSSSSPLNTTTSSPTAITSASDAALLPIFITCDPARDTPSVIKSYLAEFHPAMVGLTGTWEQVKAVYPEGDFVEAIGRQHSAEQAARIIREHMGDWEGGVKKA
ncbi:Cu-binding protein [Hypocenomyce scalaris]|nr:Cu-binding protein [Hypocenomyce scalaris]